MRRLCACPASFGPFEQTGTRDVHHCVAGRHTRHSVYQTLSQKVIPSLAFNARVQQLAQHAVDSLGHFDALVVHNHSDVAALTGRNSKVV